METEEISGVGGLTVDAEDGHVVLVLTGDEDTEIQIFIPVDEVDSFVSDIEGAALQARFGGVQGSA